MGSEKVTVKIDADNGDYITRSIPLADPVVFNTTIQDLVIQLLIEDITWIPTKKMVSE